jgi:cyclophilin family peptidyl-prolyl cis-trans isomerase
MTTTSLLLIQQGTPDANALLASPNTQIPRTSEAALRRSIPAFNSDVYSLQKELESIQYKLRIPQRKPWTDMLLSATKAADIVRDEAAIFRGIQPSDEEQARDLLAGIQSDVGRLAKAIEIKDPDRTSIRVSNALERVASLELLQTPGISFSIPKQFKQLPRLVGRAKVELTLQKKNGSSPFYIQNSGNNNKARLELTLDGFSAPLTAGRFALNVKEGLYNGATLRVDDTSIFGEKTSEMPIQEQLPLEIFARGDFEPTYRSALDINSGEIPVLPLSIYGSVAMTKSQDGSSSPSEFFIFKYNRQQSGLSGFSFDEGQFGVFGYVTSDELILRQVEDGDTIVSAKVVDGEDKLVVPSNNK